VDRGGKKVGCHLLASELKFGYTRRREFERCPAMADDKIEKRIEFIIEQQAQFATDIQQLRESQAKTDQMLNRLAAVTLEGFKDVNSKIDALVDAQIRTDENLKTTNETLNNLIAVVDRYFRNQNGKSQA
jgi:hypothetical protein